MKGLWRLNFFATLLFSVFALSLTFALSVPLEDILLHPFFFIPFSPLFLLGIHFFFRNSPHPAFFFIAWLLWTALWFIEVGFVDITILAMPVWWWSGWWTAGHPELFIFFWTTLVTAILNVLCPALSFVFKRGEDTEDTTPKPSSEVSEVHTEHKLPTQELVHKSEAFREGYSTAIESATAGEGPAETYSKNPYDKKTRPESFREWDAGATLGRAETAVSAFREERF